MKLTTTKTPYLLIDFTDEIYGFNAVFAYLDESNIKMFTEAKALFQRISSENDVQSIELHRNVGTFITLDGTPMDGLRKKLRESPRTHFLEATEEEIETIVYTSWNTIVHCDTKLFYIGTEVYFTLSLKDQLFNSTLEYTSRPVCLKHIGI